MHQAQRTAHASVKIAEALSNPFHSPNLGPASHCRDADSERGTPENVKLFPNGVGRIVLGLVFYQDSLIRTHTPNRAFRWR